MLELILVFLALNAPLESLGIQFELPIEKPALTLHKFQSIHAAVRNGKISGFRTQRSRFLDSEFPGKLNVMCR